MEAEVVVGLTIRGLKGTGPPAAKKSTQWGDMTKGASLEENPISLSSLHASHFFFSLRLVAASSLDR